MFPFLLEVLENDWHYAKSRLLEMVMISTYVVFFIKLIEDWFKIE